MVTSTKFASLVGTVTLAFVLASSLQPVHSAPVALHKRQDAPSAAAAGSAGFISVAQPQMSEQDIYAVGIPDSPTSATTGEDQLQQVLQAAASAALSGTNQTIDAINHYDATPPVAGAAPSAAQVTAKAQAAQPDSVMTGNPDVGNLYQQVIGTPAGAPSSANNTEAGYDQVVAQQMAQLGAHARRTIQQAVDAAKRDLQPIERSALGLGVPSPSSATLVPSVAAPVESGAATAASSTADVPVAPPVPSDFSSPPVENASSAADIPAASSAPAVPDVAASVSSLTPALPTDAAPSLVPTDVTASTSAVPSVPTAAGDAPAVPSVSAPVSAAPETPSTSVPSVAAPSALATSTPSVPSLDASAASATTLLPTSDASPLPVSTSVPAVGDVTMTVTLPTKSLPTSIADLPNVKANNAVDADWKTMTILVPAEAFGGAGMPSSSSSPAASSAASSSKAEGDKNLATSTSVSTSASPTIPPNLSSFSSLKPSPTASILTIPLTGVIDGISYSTMLTLTVPGFGGPAVTSALSLTSTDKATPTSSPAKATSTSLTTSTDASYINPDLVPPLLKSSSAPSATPTGSSAVQTPTDSSDEECEDDSENADGSATPKSLLTKVWDWVTGKPLNERDFDEDYEYDDQWYDAQEE